MDSTGKAGFVRDESNALLLRTGRFIWQMHILSALLMTWLLWTTHQAAVLLAWAGWMIVLAGVQGHVCFRGALESRRSDQPSAVLGRAARRFDITAVLLALGWGWLILVLSPSENERVQGFIGFLAGGAVLTGAGTHNLRYGVLVTTLLIILPAMIARGLIDDIGGQGWAAAGMLVLFGGLMLGLGWMLRVFTRRGFALQWEKAQLADRLELQTVELQAARVEADIANAAKSRFLAQASHDLRQPIHSMGLFLASLTREKLSPKASEIVARLDQSVANLSELFGSLLDVTLLETGQTQADPRGFCVGELVEQVAEEFRPLADSEAVQLDIATQACTIGADRLIVWRILQNLVSNAIRHGAGGRVRISVNPTDKGVMLEVQDWGRGIPSANQARIFDEFETGRSGGMGLGLAIVQRLVEVSGVRVHLESEEGAGATFRVGPFPVADAIGARDLDDVEDVVEAAGTAWIIDDDRPTLEATRDLLERWGWEVETMTEPPGDLAGLARPDLIISDYDLGADRTGVEVVAAVRGCFGAVPAVIISGSSSAETRQDIADRGLVLLHKPVRPVQLRSAILGAVS